MSLGPVDREYVTELLRKESAWLQFAARRQRVNGDKELLQKADAIDMYLRNGGPMNLLPVQARLVIEALNTAHTITPVADESARATWQKAVEATRLELLPYTVDNRVGKRPGYRFKRG